MREVCWSLCGFLRENFLRAFKEQTITFLSPGADCFLTNWLLELQNEFVIMLNLLEMQGIFLLTKGCSLETHMTAVLLCCEAALLLYLVPEVLDLSKEWYSKKF